jgi:GH18 family chitinase
MKEFRTQLDALKKNAYLVSYDAPAGEWAFTNINIGAVDSYVNYVDLMTYDYAGPWQNQTKFVAALYATKYDPDKTLNINFTVEAYLAAGAGPSKILLGVPFYGYGWQVPGNAPNPEGQFDHTAARYSRQETAIHKATATSKPRSNLSRSFFEIVGPTGVTHLLRGCSMEQTIGPTTMPHRFTRRWSTRVARAWVAHSLGK